MIPRRLWRRLHAKHLRWSVLQWTFIWSSGRLVGIATYDGFAYRFSFGRFNHIHKFEAVIAELRAIPRLSEYITDLRRSGVPVKEAALIARSRRLARIHTTLRALCTS